MLSTSAGCRPLHCTVHSAAANRMAHATQREPPSEQDTVAATAVMAATVRKPTAATATAAAAAAATWLINNTAGRATEQASSLAHRRRGELFNHCCCPPGRTQPVAAAAASRRHRRTAPGTSQYISLYHGASVWPQPRHSANHRAANAAPFCGHRGAPELSSAPHSAHRRRRANANGWRRPAVCAQIQG